MGKEMGLAPMWVTAEGFGHAQEGEGPFGARSNRFDCVVGAPCIASQGNEPGVAPFVEFDQVRRHKGADPMPLALGWVQDQGLPHC